MKKFDVAILGAGPAGNVAAHVLLKAGRSVLILDQPKANDAGRKVGESLPAAARPLLRHLGLLRLVEKGPHLSSFGNHSAWGSSSIATNEFVRGPDGLGWHLDRRHFDTALRASAIAHGAQIEYGSDLSGVPARFLIDASGRAATLARVKGAQRLRDDQLMAVFLWVQPHLRDRDTRTLIESSRDGWWYTARLMDDSRMVVFHTDRDKVTDLLRSPLLWKIELERTVHIRETLRQAKPLSELYCAEASGARLDHFHGDDWTACGDAALSFDPLSSQGLYNALYTGMRAGEAVHAHLGGDRFALRDYADRLEQIRRVYSARRQMHYAIERRWPTAPFWRQRIQVTS